VVSLHASESVPFGSFSDLLETADFSPLEPDVLEHKFYEPAIGIVLEVDENGRNELVSIADE